jgi:hypothetical protein
VAEKSRLPAAEGLVGMLHAHETLVVVHVDPHLGVVFFEVNGGAVVRF